MIELLDSICGDITKREREHFARTLSKIQLTTFLPSANIFASGAPFNGIYLIKCGMAKSFTRIDDQEIFTMIALPGDVMGCESLHSGIYESTLTSAVETEAIWIPTECLALLLRVSPQFRSYLNGKISRAIAENDFMICVLAKAKAEARVAYLLLKLFKATQDAGGGNNRKCLSLSRVEMADYLGLQFETVSRKLRLFSKLGHVRVSGKTIQVRNPAALKQICHSLAAPGC
jgi:CRP/FNR family transcriptional regulator